MAGLHVSEQVSAPPTPAEDRAPDIASAQPARPPMAVNRLRPVPPTAQGQPVQGQSASEQSGEPKRPNPLQASLRRRPLAAALHFDTPPDTNKVARPTRGNAAPPVAGTATGTAGPANGTARPANGTAGPVMGGHPDERPTTPDLRGAPAPGVAWNSESVRFPSVAPRTPVFEQPGPAAAAPTWRPFGGLGDNPGGTGSTGGASAGGAAPANGLDPQFRPARATAPGGAVRPTVGNGRHPSPAAPAFPAAALPEALKAFAPGAPNLFVEMAAMTSGSPQWKPGDDDVMPADGRRARRPRLWDHLPW